jgi:lipopolysaccharide transport system ATP-binding protein
MARAIQVENLSKQYRLGQIGTGSLTHDINRWWHTVRGKEDPYLKIGETNDRSQKGTSEYVWSLKDINFSIEQGDSVGIIGRNGAGKSTLLKILSRVTAPTTGNLKVKGRIASLLEVGTGFHPDLSGRDNIYLNGAILGMRKHEIKKKFDEIVDFAGVERYIDTPVKRYSSGMYVRLAFAVAAHLESEILIVDEVLAVGDAEFQKKCLGKMGQVSKGEGRTVLFVSHNMGSIATLCTKGIILSKGFLEYKGETGECIRRYHAFDGQPGLRLAWENHGTAFYDEHFLLEKVALVDASLQPLPTGTVTNEEELCILFEGSVSVFHTGLKIGYDLFDQNQQLLFTQLSTNPAPAEWIDLQIGHNKIITSIPLHLLKPGRYTVSVHVSIHHQKWICNSRLQELTLNFSVINSQQASPYLGDDPGMIQYNSPFRIVTDKICGLADQTV